MAFALRKRSEIEEKYTWDLARIFHDTDRWQQTRKEVEESLPKLQKYQGTLGESPQKLLAWFRDYEQTFIKVNQLLTYSTMLHDSDTTVQESVALKDQGRGIFSRFAAAVSFAEPELLDVPQEQIDGFMEQEPQLQQYRHYFNTLRRREGHVRS